MIVFVSKKNINVLIITINGGRFKQLNREIMARHLYIRTKTSVRCYALGKDVRPLTTVSKRLYRTDDCLMIADRESDNQFVMYDIDQTRPYFLERRPYLIRLVNPDKTFAYIDLIKQAGLGASKISIFSRIPAMYLLYGAIGIVIVYAVIAGAFQ